MKGFPLRARCRWAAAEKSSLTQDSGRSDCRKSVEWRDGAIISEATGRPSALSARKGVTMVDGRNLEKKQRRPMSSGRIERCRDPEMVQRRSLAVWVAQSADDAAVDEALGARWPKRCMTLRTAKKGSRPKDGENQIVHGFAAKSMAKAFERPALRGLPAVLDQTRFIPVLREQLVWRESPARKRP